MNLCKRKCFYYLKKKPEYRFSTEYHKSNESIDDLRDIITPKNIKNVPQFETKEYTQVFETKHGFIPNLSILDLLFNQGSRALEFI